MQRDSSTADPVRSGSSIRRSLRVLVVEDSEADTLLISTELRRSEYSPTCWRVDTPKAMTEALAQDQWDLVVSDCTMPGFSGAAALAIFKKSGLGIPFLFVSGTLSPEAAEAAKKVGVRECIPKADLRRLGPAVERELRDVQGRLNEGKCWAEGQKRDDLPGRTPLGKDDLITDCSMRKCSTTPSVLLVDDHPENLTVLEAILEGPGISLDKATSGQEALGLALEKEFALILLDVRMPQMDGFEVAELLHGRQKTKSVPVIFLTAHPDNPEEISRGYAVGAVDHIAKPFVAEHLKAKVSVFLELYRKNVLLVEQTERMAGLTRGLESFSSSVSHDLRAPLRAMRAFSRNLLSDHAGELTADARGELARIEAAGSRMDNLSRTS